MEWNVETLVAAAVPFFFISIFIEALYSYFKKLGLYRLNDSISNLSLGMFQQVVGIYLRTFTVLFYGLFASRFQFFVLPQNLLGYAIAFLLVDLAYYVFHRKAHEVNLLWASHISHHSSEEYNLSVALRQSAVQSFFSTFFYLPLVFVGVTFKMFGVCFGLNLIYQFFIHTEVIQNLGPLEWMMNTPSHHRVHHGQNPKYIDRNHAGVFIIWDRIFKTYQKEEERPTYGITTPVRSFEPIYATFHHFFEILRNVKSAHSFHEAYLFILGPPGWKPNRLGGFENVKELSRQNQMKFNPKPSPTQMKRALIEFTAALLLTLILQNFRTHLNDATVFAISFLSVLLLSFCGRNFTSS